MGMYDNSLQSDNYQQIMNGYAQRQQQTDKDYASLYRQGLGVVNNYGQSLYDKNNNTYAQNLGNIYSQDISHGLGNTTIQGAMLTGATQGKYQADTAAADTIAQTKLGAMSNLGQAQLNARQAGSNQYAALGESGAGLAQQGALGFGNLSNQAQANAWQHQLGMGQLQQGNLQSDRNFLVGAMGAQNQQQQTANQADQFQQLYGYRQGGYVRGYAGGGPIPGYGNNDNQIIAATPGEYMLSKQMIDGLLTGKISHADLINQLKQPQESPAPQPVPVQPMGYACGGYIMSPRMKMK